MNNPSDLWLQRDHKHDLAFRPLETALEKGIIDACIPKVNRFQQVFRRRPESLQGIEDLSCIPTGRLQVANIPAAITCTDVM